MESIIAYLACVCILLIFGRLFILPIRMVAKLLINSILGIILLYIINLVGASLSFHIGINWITIAVVGLLGAPRNSPAICIKISYGVRRLSITKNKKAVGVGVLDDPQTKNSRDVKLMQNYYYNDAKITSLQIYVARVVDAENVKSLHYVGADVLGSPQTKNSRDVIT